MIVPFLPSQLSTPANLARAIQGASWSPNRVAAFGALQGAMALAGLDAPPLKGLFQAHRDVVGRHGFDAERELRQLLAGWVLGHDRPVAAALPKMQRLLLGTQWFASTPPPISYVPLPLDERPESLELGGGFVSEGDVDRIFRLNPTSPARDTTALSGTPTDIRFLIAQETGMDAAIVERSLDDVERYLEGAERVWRGAAVQGPTHPWHALLLQRRERKTRLSVQPALTQLERLLSSPPLGLLPRDRGYLLQSLGQSFGRRRLRSLTGLLALVEERFLSRDLLLRILREEDQFLSQFGVAVARVDFPLLFWRKWVEERSVANLHGLLSELAYVEWRAKRGDTIGSIHQDWHLKEARCDFFIWGTRELVEVKYVSYRSNIPFERFSWLFRRQVDRAVVQLRTSNGGFYKGSKMRMVLLLPRRFKRVLNRVVPHLAENVPLKIPDGFSPERRGLLSKTVSLLQSVLDFLPEDIHLSVGVVSFKNNYGTGAIEAMWDLNGE